MENSDVSGGRTGTDGFGLVQRVTETSGSIGSVSKTGIVLASSHVIQDAGARMPSPHLREKDAMRSLGRPHSAMARRRATEDRGEVGRARQRPASAHAALQRHGSSQQDVRQQQGLQQDVMVEDTEEEQEKEERGDAMAKECNDDAAAKNQVQISASIRRPHSHTNWVLQASSPNTAVKAGKYTQTPLVCTPEHSRITGRTIYCGAAHFGNGGRWGSSPALGTFPLVQSSRISQSSWCSGRVAPQAAGATESATAATAAAPT